MDDTNKTVYNTSIPVSLAYSFGNITSIVTNYFKSRFPKDFFKNEYINGEMSFNKLREIRHDIMKMKKEKPILVINPTFDFNDMPEFVNNNILNSTFLGMYDSRRPSYDLMKVFQDYDNNIFLDGKLSRYRIRYEFTIIMETDIQAINLVNYLLSSFRHEHPFTINKSIEIQLQDFILNQISADSKVPIIGDNDNIGSFLRYLNMNSKYPFLYKLKPASGKNEFFMLMEDLLLLLFNNKPDLERASRNNMVKSTSSIVTESLIVEFNSMSTFYYKSEHQHDSLQNHNSYNNILSNTSLQISDSFSTLVIDKVNQVGWNLCTTALFGITNEEEDTTEIEPLIDKEVLDVIKYNNEIGVNNNIFIDIVVSTPDDILPKDRYSIDFDKMTITIFNGVEKTYRLSLYVNNEYMNTIKK